MKKKLTGLTALALISAFVSHGAFAETAEIKRMGDYVSVTARIPNADAGSNVSITAYPKDYDLSSLESYSGEIRDFYVVAQNKLDSEHKTEIKIPISNLYSGIVNVRFNTLFGEYIEELKICQVNIMGNSGGTVEEAGINKVVSGERITLNIKPDEGYRLSSISVNDMLIPMNITEQSAYITDPINTDTNILYNFVRTGEFDPGTIAEKTGYTESDITPNITPDDRVKISGKLSALLKADLATGANGYSFVSAGFLLSDAINNIYSANEKCIDIPVSDISDDRTYAVLFTGNTSCENITFYAQAYTEFKSDNNETTRIYSEVKQFKLSPFTQKLYFPTVLKFLNINTNGISVHRLD